LANNESRRSTRLWALAYRNNNNKPKRNIVSGILDPKTRVMDVVITDEGRRQMASGLMELAYVTFSDADVVYAKDLVSGTVDTTTYPHLEASTSQPHDLITYVTDDFGSLQPFKSLNSYTVRSGEILSGSDGVYSPVT
jgi:hypothetical protein